VLASGSGTTLQNLIDRIGAGTLAARIELVVSSRAVVLAVERAKGAGLAVVVIPRKEFGSVAEFSRACSRQLRGDPLI